MAVTIDATVGGVNSNSYLTHAEAFAYMNARSVIPEWDDADDPDMLIVMATRVFESMFQPRRVLVRLEGKAPYYRVSPTWTGQPATTTQALSWPRTGMFNRNGGEILSTVIPQEIKYAVAELAGQLAKGDRNDNDVIAQGITSIKAGSVALTFKNSFEFDVIPSAVWNLLVQSWLTDELFEYSSGSAEFCVIGQDRDTWW